LESRPDPQAGKPAPPSPTPVLQNGRYTVTLPMSEAAAYFRLHAL
jgi:hypothetical protein